MRPIVLLANYPDSAEIKEYFKRVSFNIEAVYEISQRSEILKDYSQALVFVRLQGKDKNLRQELVSIFDRSGISIVFLADAGDNTARTGDQNNVFAYLDLPIIKRELEMLIHHHELIMNATDCRHSGELISDREERFHSLFESMPKIAVQGYDSMRRVMFWNGASEKLYGYSSEEASGKRIEELIIPDEMKDKVIKEIGDYFNQDTEITASEMSLSRKDGGRVHVYSSHSIFTNFAGDKILYSVDLDLTQIKRHQLIQEVLSEIVAATNSSDSLHEFLQSLRKSLSRVINTRNFFVALYNEADNSFSLPLFIDDVDKFRSFPAGRTLTAHMLSLNKPLLLTQEEMTGLEDQGIIDRVGTPCKLWLGIPLRRENKVKGALVFQSYTDETVYDETDIKTLQIVAEQISVAIERKARQEQLRESERAMKTLISNLPGIAYRCKFDSLWTMEFLSDGFTILTGYPVENFISGEKSFYSDIIHAGDKTDVSEQVIKAVAGRESYHLVYRIITCSRVIKWVWEKGSGVFDENGDIIALEGFIIDITDRVEMEKQIISAKEQAEEANRLKSSFLANLSHEIRSPMNSIMGFCELLKSEKAEEPVSQYIEIIVRSSRQLLNVINDTVDISKIDSGLMPVRNFMFQIEDLMNALGKYASEQVLLHGKKSIGIKHASFSSLNGYKFYSDENLISQVMSHLINNAIKFTDKGIIEIGFEIKDDRYISFFVKDTGIGISPENHEIIFERFRQVDETATRNFDGTGLGLAICKGIAQLLGGSIRVESNPGNGSAFFFNVPVK
jgi:PAS domain S-box-containing protein